MSRTEPHRRRPTAHPRGAAPVLGLAIGLVLFAGCAGYQIGAQSLYPQDVRTVHVPVFESTSFRRNLGERLTEAVAKEIERKTNYKVVGDAGADSILSGRIVGESKHLTIQSRSGEPREVQADLQIEVSWVDRRGAVLRPPQMVPLPPEMTEIGAAANVIPEVGQSVATAHQQAIERLAEQIVALMEAPW